MNNGHAPYHMGDLFDFDVMETKTQQVKFRDRLYTLSAATEDASIAYEAQRLKGSTVIGEGRVRLGEASAECDIVLVSKCLSDPQNRFVSVGELRKWPHHHIEAMATWVKENTPGMLAPSRREEIERDITRLQKKLTELDANPPVPLEKQAKNSLNATVATSG